MPGSPISQNTRKTRTSAYPTDTRCRGRTSGNPGARLPRRSSPFVRPTSIRRREERAVDPDRLGQPLVYRLCRLQTRSRSCERACWFAVGLFYVRRSTYVTMLPSDLPAILVSSSPSPRRDPAGGLGAARPHRPANTSFTSARRRAFTRRTAFWILVAHFARSSRWARSPTYTPQSAGHPRSWAYA